MKKETCRNCDKFMVCKLHKEFPFSKAGDVLGKVWRTKIIQESVNRDLDVSRTVLPVLEAFLASHCVYYKEGKA